ncbi:unnamed protein product [Didymodactylos carnosus]|uniref:Uncharacterized protein n=1 Tax=Didymodactylos carnosus TaxID=1234261 RepID=A0A814XSR5_9BILA|nr:unnamed protein product [Didymodactylos carnosus]CAF1220049.1 unnamed protein product [Didymodactylos carnosus]CAF3610752.1 unnamed protein product [Didymodactylos carnosus]CAF3983544.1 unnamed protein product [Didymodactylos carnosus]
MDSQSPSYADIEKPNFSESKSKSPSSNKKLDCCGYLFSNFSKLKSKSRYSNKKLDCEGRACVECGHCRDWHWRPDGNEKDYTKRGDATCTSDGFSRGFRRYDYYHFIYSVSYFDGIDVIDNRLCQCDDNRS